MPADETPPLKRRRKQLRDVRIGKRFLKNQDMTSVEGVRDAQAWALLAAARGTITADESRAITQAAQVLLEAIFAAETMAKKRAKEAAAVPQPDGDPRPISGQ